MKNLCLIFMLCSLFWVGNASAQAFYNGSLEPSSSAIVNPCHDNPYYNINTIGSVWLTTAGPAGIYVANNACGIGYAKDGSYYLGMHYSPVLRQGNQLLLELNADMKAAKSYTFSFYYKGPAPIVGTGADLEFGYGVSDSTIDTTIVAFINAPSDTLWKKVIVAITPPVDCRYIWVAAGTKAGDNDSGTTYVDYFVFDPPASVPDLATDGDIKVYPQPFTSAVTIELSNHVTLPCSYILHDISGRVVKQAENINSKKIYLDKGSLGTGSYFLQLIDHDHKTYATKLVAE